MHTLTLVFNKDKTHVLLCNHLKYGGYNYIGGKIEELEDTFTASYRELFEETGISKDTVDLYFVRQETVVTTNTNLAGGIWSMFITAGILKEDVNLIEEKNPLLWVPITDIDTFLYKCIGNGNCYVFLCEAMKVCGL